MTFSPDSQQIAAVFNDGLVRIWRQHDGVLLRNLTAIKEQAPPDDQQFEDQLHFGPFKPVSYAYPTIAFSADSSTIAALGDDGTLRIWDVQSKTLLSDVHLPAGNMLMFAPDGQTVLAATQQNKIHIVRVRDGAEIRTIDGITDLTISPDNAFATAFDGALRFWRANDGTPLSYVAHGHTSVRTMAFSPDSTKLATGGNIIRIWDIPDNTLLQTISAADVHSVAFSSDGRLLAELSNGGETIRVWNTDDGTLHTTFSGNFDIIPGQQSYSIVTFSATGATLAAGFQDGTVLIGRISDGEILHTMKAHDGPMISVAFDQNGQTLITCSIDRTAKVWDVHTGTHVQTRYWHSRPVIGMLTCSPDGNLVVANAGDGLINMWQIEP
jgi:WD40 repeat protein